MSASAGPMSNEMIGARRGSKYQQQRRRSRTFFNSRWKTEMNLWWAYVDAMDAYSVTRAMRI
ncbi:MAG: hypothetical protein JOZ81_29035 [Chloroflexi bacterium]|nr:hypothetical protein [Chloroflexota bacterium]